MSENLMPNLDLNIIPLHRKAAENQETANGQTRAGGVEENNQLWGKKAVVPWA